MNELGSDGASAAEFADDAIGDASAACEISLGLPSYNSPAGGQLGHITCRHITGHLQLAAFSAATSGGFWINVNGSTWSASRKPLRFQDAACSPNLRGPSSQDRLLPLQPSACEPQFPVAWDAARADIGLIHVEQR